MTLKEYLEGRVTAGEFPTQLRAAVALAARSGVSLVTIKNVCQGLKLRRADKAKALAEATDGLVTEKELTE